MGLKELLAAQNATSPAPDPAVAGAIPAHLPPAAAPPVAVVPPAVAPVASANIVTTSQQLGAGNVPLGGGQRLASVFDALETASSGGQRNDLPVGTGAFLLKDGSFKVSQGRKHYISSFQFLCLVGGTDGNGIACGTPGYAGPIPGEVYQVAMFLDTSPKYAKGTLGKVLRAVRVCMGWEEGQMKNYQTDPTKKPVLLELIKGLLCVDLDTLIGTGQPCLFANQVVVQLSSKMKRIEQKGPQGQTMIDPATGVPTVKDYQNTYWDERVPLLEILEAVGQEKIIAAFGSAELFNQAAQN